VSKEVKLVTVSTSSLTQFKEIEVVAFSLACSCFERAEKAGAGAVQAVSARVCGIMVTGGIPLTSRLE